jgi:hypothetical protein
VSEEPILDMDQDYQKFVMKVMAGGHELVPERRLYRHKSYRKDFPKGTPIKVDGVQYITHFGVALTTDMVLPERADLCLDSDGNLVSQQTFTARFREWLRWFEMPEGSDIESEFIPDVHEYVASVPDTFGESRGFIEVGYDATKPAETVPTHKYDPRTDEMVEIKETQKMIAETLAQLAKSAAVQSNQQGKR